MFQLFQSQVIFSHSGGITSARITTGPSGESSTRMPPATISGLRIGSIVCWKAVQASAAHARTVSITPLVLSHARWNSSSSQFQASVAPVRSGSVTSHTHETIRETRAHTSPPTPCRKSSAGTASPSHTLV